MARFGKSIWLVAVPLLAGVVASAQVQHQEHHPPRSTSRYIKALEDPSRDAWQQPEKVVEALTLRPGDSVADIGAGPGYFTLRFARAVGPTGKVYGVDISREMLDYLEKQAKSEHLTNIQPVLAEPHDPQLPAVPADVIFICDTLHHISDRAKYFPLVVLARRPGAWLANVDVYNRELPARPPVEMKIPQAEMIAAPMFSAARRTRTRGIGAPAERKILRLAN